MKLYIEYKLFILFCLYFHLSSSSSPSSPYIVRTLQNPKCSPENCSLVAFTHLAQDDTTGTLYIGGTNYLYKVNSNLTIVEMEETGPRMDNPECYYPKSDNCKHKIPFNSYVKTLLIDKANQNLIHCTSLFQGSCEKRLLSNLTMTFSTTKPIVGNNQSATTVAFIAPGPWTEIYPDTFYVGVSWTNTGLAYVRALVPTFASRRLTNFDFVYNYWPAISYKKIDMLYRETFPIRYIYGFSSGKFSYMATVQKENTKSERYTSKLLRVCQYDPKFYSYAELELRCRTKGDVYNLLQVAHIGKPGQKLAKMLGISNNEDVLFGMFMIGADPAMPPKKQETAMCVYKMRDIRKVFTKNIKSCFGGIGNTGPDYLDFTTTCQQSVSNQCDTGTFRAT